jgi:ATP-dependent RNA helicase RhlE
MLGLSPAVCAPLAKLGYSRPTPVQVESIPIILRGSDLLARAQTGTGKTAAFALPIIDRLSAGRRHSARPGAPRALVLVPTRELAIQVHKSLTTYGAASRLRSVVIFGGVPIRAQIQALRQGADIIVATPGRLLDHMQQRTVDLKAVEILTLDEADRMLDMGFLPPLRRVLAALSRERQTLLLSATFTKEVIGLAGEFTREPARVDVSNEQVVAPTVTHRVHPVAEGRKAALLTHVLMQPPVGQALVFCKTKRGANRVGESLEKAGLRASVIHGNKSQGARNRALGDFKAGRVAILVATDLAARGLDIVQLPLVVNYDLPLVAEDYVHRVGRTGRAGLAGRAVSLVAVGDRDLLTGIERLMTSPLERVVVPGFEPLPGERPSPEARTARYGRRGAVSASRRPSAAGGRTAGARPHGERPRSSGQRRSAWRG